MVYNTEMRVEPFTVGSYVHVLKRGARGMPVVNDAKDRERFLRVLYVMNDEHFNEDWDRQVTVGSRPAAWPQQKPLVEVIGYTLMNNHIHLMLREIQQGGISTFMKKVGQSMTNHFNKKYNQKGSLFQGSYKSRTINDDVYLRYVAAYIMVKNTLELYPKGGLHEAIEHFEDAWRWAVEYRFSSLREYMNLRDTHILQKGFLNEVFGSAEKFKIFARDVLSGGKWLQGVEL